MYPPVLDMMPAVVGIKSGGNVLIYFGMVVLFYGLFRLVVKVEELEYRICEMNRKIALGLNSPLRSASFEGQAHSSDLSDSADMYKK